MASKAKVGVLGASGYTGAELVRLLLRHPRVEIALLTADRRAGQEMREVFPQFSPFDLPRLVAIDGVDWPGAGLDLAFCALPHATTQKVIKRICSARRRRPRWSISPPTSGSPTRRLCALVRPRAPRAGAAEGGGLRPGRGLPARDQEGAARRQSRLLHDLRAASARSAAARPRRSIPTRSSSTPSRA